MPFDIVAFLESQTATALSGVAAVADTQYQTNGDDLIVKPQKNMLVGLLQIGVSTPKYAQIRQPSLRTPYTFYKSCLATDLDHRAGFTDLWKRPLPLYGDEKLNAYVQNATAEYSAIVLWLASGGVSQGYEYAKPTHLITGYADATLTANVWNTVTPTWDVDLPKGTYQVLNVKAGSYLGTCNPIATRLILDGVTSRAGVITSELGGDKTLCTNELSTVADQVFPSIPELKFDNLHMPKFEMLSLTADTDHVFELLLAKVA